MPVEGGREGVGHVEDDRHVDKREADVGPRRLSVTVGEDHLDHPGVDEDDHDQGKDGQGHRTDDPVLQVVDQAGGPGDHVDEDQVIEQFDQ